MNLTNSSDDVRDEVVAPAEESTFGDILNQYDQEHKTEPGQSLPGTVVSVSAEAIIVDIGRKMEGQLNPAPFTDAAGKIVLSKGDAVQVVVTGRNPEGYYELSALKVKRPVDWTGFKKAFEEKAIVAGTVTEIVKGGLRVDMGVRAFLPASRSGARDPIELEKLLGQEIRCRITKIDEENDDVVVDRRGVLEEEAAQAKQHAFELLQEGSVVHGTVRTVTDFGAFVDLGGVDGLLHIADMSWHRVAKPSDVVSVGDSVEVKILKIDAASRRISLGIKQLQPDPWTLATENLKQGDRVKGKVVRLADFGAFVEIAPGVDGLIHLSSLSWGKRVRKPSDVVKVGDQVDAVVMEVKASEKRISLSLKEALGDPWEEADTKFPAGTIVEDAPITNMAKFGAFVDLGEGLEGMIHVADITREKRLDHPKELLTVGQKVRAIVLETDRAKRRIRLGMKQLEPTAIDHFFNDHKIGETLSGRVTSVEGNAAKVELAEGVTGLYRFPKEEAPPPPASKAPEPAKSTDLSSMTAMLTARWKQGGTTGPTESAPRKERMRVGEIRMFRIVLMDPNRKIVDVELVP